MRMTAAMAGAAVYIAMVGGGGADVWRQSSRLGNSVSLCGRQMDGRHLCRLKAEQSPAPGSGAGGADRFGRKARAGAREVVWVGQGSQTRAWQWVGPAPEHAGSPVSSPS